MRANNLDFLSLVGQEADYLQRYACGHVSNQEAARDLVQETFLAAVEGAKRFRGDSKPRTWLVAILRHKILDYIRRNARRLPAIECDPGEDASVSLINDGGHWRRASGPGADGSPEASMLAKQFVEVLAECLKGLTSRLREAFLLKEVNGLSPQEICGRLGISAANLRVLLHRSRHQLRDGLEKHWLS